MTGPLTERSARVAAARRLTRRAGRDAAGLFLAEGRQAVAEALADSAGTSRRTQTATSPCGVTVSDRPAAAFSVTSRTGTATSASSSRCAAAAGTTPAPSWPRAGRR